MATHPDTLLASDYVICATLRKIPDVFNADLLWESVRGAHEGVCLLEALQRHPRTTRSRNVRATYYSHVIVRITERDYVRDQRLEDGQGRRALLHALHDLHQHTLGCAPPEDGGLRYRLEPDATLRAGEVQFLFGRAIYLPSDGENALFRVEAAAEGRDEWRDLGPIYPNQRLTLLNGDRRNSSFPIMAWPFTKGEAVLLVLQAAANGMVDVLAEPPESLALSSDEDGGFIARDYRQRGLRLRVIAQQYFEAKTPTLSLSPAKAAGTLRSDAATAQHDLQVDAWGRREPVFGIALNAPDLEPVALPAAPRNPAVTPAELHTIAPQANPARGEAGTWIPRRSQPSAPRLKVVGVALQRLSTYATAGIRDWRLSFNQHGALVRDADLDAVACVHVDSRDQMFVETAAGISALEIPKLWSATPQLQIQFHSMPPALAEHYLGWILLPQAVDLPVARGKALSFGRGKEADLAPQLLADPQALRWEGQTSQAAAVSAEYLGLSRRHLRLQTREHDWWVELESQNMAAYRLDADGALLEVLTPGVNTAAAAAPGELLVAGGYVLELGTVR